MRFRWKRARLTWKITGAFLGTLLFCAIFTLCAVYLLTSRLLNEQIDQRALGLAINLADSAAGQISMRNVLALHAVVARYTAQDNVAYALIRGRDGQVLAHSLGGMFPAELGATAPSNQRNLNSRRTFKLEGRPVYETSAPIMGGQLGSAHVGIWGDVAETQIKTGLAPILVLIGCLFLLASAVALLLSRHIVRRITRLQVAADQISKGRLDESIRAGPGDEIDQLAKSLERMRTSLKAAMVRLRDRDSQITHKFVGKEM
jgi:HAMP domain-containing protein